jgi:hypothetical protein
MKGNTKRDWKDGQIIENKRVECVCVAKGGGVGLRLIFWENGYFQDKIFAHFNILDTRKYIKIQDLVPVDFIF